MSQPTPFALSQRFSQLVGRAVTFRLVTTGPDPKTKKVYGIYSVLPQETPVVVQAELCLLGSFAGSLVGLPDKVVKEHLLKMPIQEILLDAIHEVLNIASATVSDEGRVVFKKMVTDAAYIEGAAAKMFRRPDLRSYFAVDVEGYQGGRFSIFAEFYAGRVVCF
jgi:hypothetical protein